MTPSLQDVQSRFDLWFYELDQICKIENPWGFLCLSALIDYLSRLANGANCGRKGYIQFIKDYFPDKYKNFQYKNGSKDLPEQMYYVLRNGLVHSFSLIPENQTGTPIGRERSIVLIHARGAKQDQLSHLGNYPGQHGQLDAALFVAEDFLNDTRIAAYELLQKARSNSSLESEILSWYTRYPPIKGGG